jgi:hypothetical protein
MPQCFSYSSSYLRFGAAHSIADKRLTTMLHNKLTGQQDLRDTCSAENNMYTAHLYSELAASVQPE